MRHQRRVSFQLPFEQQLPRSLRDWYSRQVGLTGEFFLVNLQDDWKRVNKEFVSRRSSYVAALRSEMDNDERILELRHAYIEDLWRLMASFYNQNQQIIDGFHTTIHFLWSWIKYLLEWDLEVANDYRNFIDSSLNNIFN